MNEQVVIQDTLKHLVEWEYEGRPASAEVLSAELAMPTEQINGVLGDLSSAGLVEPDTLKLTTSGREYALHVLRAHRLYETYLARKTGLREAQWHARAEVAEHTLSQTDVERLARELDHPRFDPHGDPIPSATGHMPPRRGRPLTEHPAGWAGRVVHVEDEPARLYALIVAANIAPGTVVRVEEKNDAELRVAAEGCTFALPLDAARQITVQPLLEGEHFDESLRRLSSLLEDERALVVGLSALCRGLERSRLLDLGVVPGTLVTIDLVSPAGNPIAYRVRGASIALRREQADRVLIRGAEEQTDG